MSNSLNCFKQYSELAMASYANFDSKDIEDTIDLPASKSFFKKYKVLYQDSKVFSGFSATLFEKIKSEEYSEELKDVADKIISFRGTDNIAHDSYMANIDWIFNKLPVVVYTDMIDFITYCIKEHYIEQNDNIAVTGHSLGGALSQLFYATFYNRFKNIQGVYTFNSPGIVGIKEDVKYIFELLYLKFSNKINYYVKSIGINIKLRWQIELFLYRYIDYIWSLQHYLSNDFISDKIYHFHTSNTFVYEKQIINIDIYLWNKIMYDLKSACEYMTPDELMSHFQYLENVIQNLNDDIEGVNYMLNINMIYNDTKQTYNIINTNNSVELFNYNKNIVSFIIDNIHNVLLIKDFYNKNKDAINTVITLGIYAHSIASSILVLNFYNYLYLCKSNHINDYTVDDYIKLFNIYTYQTNTYIFSKNYGYYNFSDNSKEYWHVYYKKNFKKYYVYDNYFYGDYLLDHKYNRPIIDIIKYIYLFAQAYSEHEGIEDENLHNCINRIEQILFSEIYDYSNVTIEIINILSKHNIYCKLIYDTERNEYENTNDISSKFIKYYRISFVPMYKNQSMITENTLTHIFGYNLQEMLSGCDDEFIALFPLQTVSIS